MLEPVYNDERAGVIGFVSTPLRAPLAANPRAWSPFFVPVYPVGSTVGLVLCQHKPVENCPDHGPLIAGAAAAIMPSVCGPGDGSGVIGHDHLMDFPGGADFDVAWEPILVLFTSKAAANEHLLTDAQIEALRGAMRSRFRFRRRPSTARPSRLLPGRGERRCRETPPSQ